MSWIKRVGFLTAFIIPALTVLGYYLGGWWNYTTVIFVFLIIPMSDILIGKDPENMDGADALVISEQFYYRFIAYVWAIFRLGLRNDSVNCIGC